MTDAAWYDPGARGGLSATAPSGPVPPAVPFAAEGTATVAEIGEAIAAARRGGESDIVLLRWTDAYPQGPEEKTHSLRRPLDVVEDVHAGDVLNGRNLRAARPGFGLPPKFLDTLLGRKAARIRSAATPADRPIFLLEEEQ